MHHGPLKAALFLTTALVGGVAFAQTDEQWPVLQPTAPRTQPMEMQHMEMQNMEQKSMQQPVAMKVVNMEAVAQPVTESSQTYQNMGYGAPVINSIGGGAIPALPLNIMVSPAGVYFVNGGIGDEEMQQLKMVENEFNVQVLMSGQKGAFVSGKHLRLLNTAGQELLNVSEAGPYVYIKLPAGSYKLEGYDQMTKIVQSTDLKVRETGVTKSHLVFNE